MDFNKAPLASDVVKSLQKLISEHGDLPLCADDPDTGWRLLIGIVFMEENISEEWPDRFEITTNYYSKPDGFVEN